jgi:hypothetical protein
MFSSHLVFGLGIAVSVLNMLMWVPIIRAQLKEFNGNASRYKTILLVFSIISLFSNVMPIWFDIARIVNDANPTNLFYAYVMTSYLYRSATVIMFWLIYRY